MEYLLQHLNGNYSKKLGYDPLNNSYASIQKNRFTKRISSIMNDPCGKSFLPEINVPQPNNSSTIETYPTQSIKRRNASMSRNNGLGRINQVSYRNCSSKRRWNPKRVDSYYNLNLTSANNGAIYEDTMIDYNSIQSDIKETQLKNHLHKILLRGFGNKPDSKSLKHNSTKNIKRTKRLMHLVHDETTKNIVQKESIILEHRSSEETDDSDANVHLIN